VSDEHPKFGASVAARGLPQIPRILHPMSRKKGPLRYQWQAPTSRRELPRRNIGSNLVRWRTLPSLRIHRPGHVKVGLSRLHGAVHVVGTRNRYRVELDQARCAPTIHVVTDNRRRARLPRQIDAMLRPWWAARAPLLRSGRRRCIAKKVLGFDQCPQYPGVTMGAKLKAYPCNSQSNHSQSDL